MIKKHKSKSNIISNEKKQQKLTVLQKKHKNKNQPSHKSTAKLVRGQNKFQNHSKGHDNNKNMHLKTKSYLQKMTINLLKQSEKNETPKINGTQRRKSTTIITQRADSRFSKRGSVVSTKSNKEKIHQNIKDNDKNHLNLHEVEIYKNKQIAENLKKSMKALKSKKKSSLNINSKPTVQIGRIQKETQKKIGQKRSQKVRQFEKKMSKYINQKDIFSGKIPSRQYQAKKKHSISKKASNQKGQISQKSLGKKQNKQRQNLLEKYQFFRKTFDINFSNCLKKGIKIDKNNQNNQNFSKSTSKPFYSSAIIEKKQVREGEFNQDHLFFPFKNQSHASIGNSFKKNEQFTKSKRSGSASVYNKENQSLLRLQRTSLINSRSKSRNSNANSQSSTKDNVLLCNVGKQNAQQNNFDSQVDSRKTKKSYKQLIVFNQNGIPKGDEQLETKKNIKDNSIVMNISSQNGENIELNKIKIGSSNIQVLKWECINQKLKSPKKIVSIQKTNSILKKSVQIFTSQEINQAPAKLIAQNNLEMISKPQRDQKQINQINVDSKKLDGFPQNSEVGERELDVTNLIKKKSRQGDASSLEDLSSISLIYQKREQNEGPSTYRRVVPIVLYFEDSAFQF